jgi:dienelactone hydrolase
MRYGLALLATVSAAGISYAQTAPQTAPAPTLAEQAATRAAANAMPDTPGTGPYPAIKQIDPNLADHVVYRPVDLNALGNRKLGVLVWGNGGCAADGASARFHLAEIASHGYLVIAPGKIFSGPGAAPAPPRQMERGAPKLAVATTAEDVRAGIGWALAENQRKGSPYYHRIDPRLVAVAGHSCGGLQALQVAGDPRIRAVIVHNSGVFTDGTNPIAGMTVDKSLLKTLHTPVLYVLGGPTDVAYPNGTDDFRKIDHVPAMLLNLEVGHGGTFREPNGGLVAQVAVNWLEWQLRHDARAAKQFTGKDCGLCTDKKWTVERKGIQ